MRGVSTQGGQGEEGAWLERGAKQRHQELMEHCKSVHQA